MVDTRGVANEIGHDGLWRWNDFAIVVDVKTTDAFSIHTATLVGYVDKLISNGAIPDWDHAMGLYVFARTDSQLKQLANSIVAEKRTHQLRIATVDDVLSVAELVQDGSIIGNEAVALFRPAGVFVADTVHLLARIAAKPVDFRAAELEPVSKAEEESPPPIVRLVQEALSDGIQSSTRSVETERSHLITPVRDEDDRTAQDTIRELLNAGWYVFGDATPGRKKLKPGDRICFYETGVGVVAEAEIASYPERQPPPARGIVKNLEKFPWSFRVTNARLFFEDPIVIDAELRSRLKAFANRDPFQSWGWFVQPTRIVTEHDFEVLTGMDAASRGLDRVQLATDRG
jgi:hypothetical protein